MELSKNFLDQQDVPFFIYDLDQLKDRSKEINDVLSPEIKLFYALKANPLSHIVKSISENEIGMDVASLGELKQVLKQGHTSSDIIFTGPYKSFEVLEEFISLGVETFVIESPQQLEDIKKLASKLSKEIHILLRLQLIWDKENKILGGKDITPFGMDFNTIKDLDLNHSNIKFLGFHIFQWGNIKKEEDLFFYWEESAREIHKFSEENALEVQIIDFGGGLGISYDDNHFDFNLKSLKSKLMEIQKQYNLKSIWFVFGRYLSGPIGQYYAKVGDLKKTRDHHLLVLDGGINHLIRPALVGEAFPVKNISRLSKEEKSFSLHGPLCTSLDRMGNPDLPSETKKGDWLCFSQTGAYGFTESMLYFLCHPTPREYIYLDGELKLVRDSVKPEDYLV